LNKKLLYLNIILVLTLFLISSCTQPIGALKKPPITNSVTYQGVLDMFNRCNVYTYERIGVDTEGLTTGTKICSGHGATCVGAEIFYDSNAGSGQQSPDWTTVSTPCNTRNAPSVLRTICCSSLNPLQQS